LLPIMFFSQEVLSLMIFSQNMLRIIFFSWLAAHSAKNVIGSTFWEKKHEWQHIRGKNIIGSKLCGKTWLVAHSRKKLPIMFYSQNVLPIMVFPRMCCQSCFSPRMCCQSCFSHMI
jgi:hypothetical protein